MACTSSSCSSSCSCSTSSSPFGCPVENGEVHLTGVVGASVFFHGRFRSYDSTCSSETPVDITGAVLTGKVVDKQGVEAAEWTATFGASTQSEAWAASQDPVVSPAPVDQFSLTLEGYKTASFTPDETYYWDLKLDMADGSTKVLLIGSTIELRGSINGTS